MKQAKEVIALLQQLCRILIDEEVIDELIETIKRIEGKE